MTSHPDENKPHAENVIKQDSNFLILLFLIEELILDIVTNEAALTMFKSIFLKHVRKHITIV